MQEANATQEEVEEAKEATEAPEEAPEETQETSKKEPAGELEEKNKQLYARAKKAEEELKKLKTEKPETKPLKEEDGDWRNKVEFLLKNKEYSEEEFDHIAGVAKNRNISLSEAAKSEKDYIQFKRKKADDENKVLSPSSPDFVSTGKTSKEIEDMSQEDYAKLLKEQGKKTAKRQGI